MRRRVQWRRLSSAPQIAPKDICHPLSGRIGDCDCCHAPAPSEDDPVIALRAVVAVPVPSGVPCPPRRLDAFSAASLFRRRAARSGGVGTIGRNKSNKHCGINGRKKGFAAI